MDNVAVAVVGLGYVGLPLAIQAAHKGYKVTGIDLNEELIKQVNSNKTPFANDDRFERALKNVPIDSFHAVSEYDIIDKASVIVICVPTPTDDNVPDLNYVLSSARSVAKHLHKGQLVVLESTVNPGVTRDDIMPILEKESKLICGKDFYLAHCPERIDPGNPKLFVGNLNRVIGGITKDCTKLAHEFYSNVVDGKLIDLNSPEEAEFVKSWENSHRNVMIALANEAAVICDALDMDIKNVLAGLQSKVDQFGLRLASPGIGPGGHCIPEDIHYVIRKARQNGIDTRFLDSAADLNDRMPKYAVSQLQKMIKQNNEKLSDLKVALLGLAYKENIEDARRSPAIDVGQLLAQRAKVVTLHDPYVDLEKIKIVGTKVEQNLDEILINSDVAFIATGHDAYKKLTPQFFRERGIKYVFDGRNIYDPEMMQSVGIIYRGVGRR
jgi:UDP-N-acetyl-D-glucosamine dehydrogenase